MKVDFFIWLFSLVLLGEKKIEKYKDNLSKLGISTINVIDSVW